MSDILWEQAITAYAAEQVRDVNRYPDECGELTLVEYKLTADGDRLVVGEEDGGYSYAIYDRDGEVLAEDGGPDVADFPAELARIARAARASEPVVSPAEQL